MRGERLAALLDYWTGQLAGAPELIALPTDRPRPAVQRFHGARLPLTLERELIDQLKALGREEGATLFMVLLAAFAALLSRLTGQDDVVIGSPVANRTEGDVAGLAGVFVNTLALRIDLAGSPSFRELLGRVRKTALDAYAHQELPFARLVEALNADRSLSHTPLFQVAFGLQENPMGTIEVPGLTAELLEARSLARDEALPDLHTGMAMFDLTFHLSEISRGVGGWIEYRTELFDEATVARMARHYETLLIAIAAAPDERVTRLPLLSSAERERLLVAWNDTAAPTPSVCAHTLFAEQVERQPEALAVVDGDVSLRYEDLDRQANRLAHALRARGVGLEGVVGLALPRSGDLIMAALATLKAGGAYLPLDLHHPPERLRFMLEDAGAQVVVTRSALQEQVAGVCDLLVLDAPAAWRAAPEHAPAGAMPGPDNLAYVIYTSGSTGRPKGVMVPHRGLVNLVTWYRRRFDLGPGCRASFVAGPAFDASIWETWSYLTSGGTLHVVPEALRTAPEQLQAWLAAHAIDICFLPTPLAELALALDWPPEITLRVLHSGGARLLSHPDPALPFALVNDYGPTENSVISTMAIVEPTADAATSAPSIGRPIDNVRCYVLDEEMRPSPVGVPGELYLGGAGLARGYLARPGLTAASFVPDPFSCEPGARLYRTGDLVRYLPDGRLDFVSRVDTQVKVRGYRIELGEIETLLVQHSAVREAVVLVREGRLVAYVVSVSDQAPAFTRLEEALRRSLPDYMIPTAWVVLDALPLTPNGKVDHRALPEPVRDGGQMPPFVAPRNPMEEVIAGIWGDLLDVDEVGIHDNFFRMGGHSLLATRFFSRLYKAFGIEVPLRTLFEAPTVAEFTTALVALPYTERQVMRMAELYLHVLHLSDEEVAAALAVREVA
jgi:amino acid adenylation domain-containing protein